MSCIFTTILYHILMRFTIEQTKKGLNPFFYFNEYLPSDHTLLHKPYTSLTPYVYLFFLDANSTIKSNIFFWFILTSFSSLISNVEPEPDQGLKRPHTVSLDIVIDFFLPSFSAK